MADFFAFYPPGGGGGTNASVGPNGDPIPTSSTQVGGEDPSGNLEPLHLDADGNLLVSLAADPIDPLGVNLTEVGGVAISLGQKTEAASIPVTIASDQSAIPASQSGAWSVTATQATGSNLHVQVDASALPTGAATAANQATEIASLGTISSNTSKLADAIAPINTSSPANTVSIGVVNASGDLEALPFGQGPMTASLPVVIASDQSAVDVNVQGTVPISGTVAVTQGTSPWVVGQSTASSLNATVVQATGSNLHTVVDSGSITVSGTVAATQSGTWTVQPGNTANTTPWLVNDASRAQASPPVFNSNSSSNITTAAYLQLTASTTSATSYVECYNQSASSIYFATGAAASEVNQFIIPPGGNGFVPIKIAVSTRISVKAVDVNATTGSLIVNYWT